MPFGPGSITVVGLLLFSLLMHGPVQAQDTGIVIATDSILPVTLDEVILIASYRRALEHGAQQKPLSTLDAYLESSRKVSMVKRGAYAWEPMLNDMGSNRLSVTIDGMRIFGACTDVMDPITSYVDVSNLSEVHVASGQQGAEHGSVIGGAIDMRLEKSNFGPDGWTASVETGGETNNAARILGGELNYSDDRFYVDSDIVYRKADNYVAGGGEEVAFSQFEKYNLSANAGYKVSEGQKLLASLIIDEARDVGYPALPMDVSLARAFIGSATWVQQRFIGGFVDWETKLYANSVTHIMDDSQRPDVPVRMDMPGWSDTYGYFSQARLPMGDHQLLLKLDGFYNRSLAEMTMYPNNPDESEMFMLTWPDVRTLNNALYAEEKWSFDKSTLSLATRLALQKFHVADALGLNSLRIFYPEMAERQTRFLKSVSAQYHTGLKPFRLNGGLSYGERAPTVSEGFGFYLFNSFDNHDYIGSPGLKNEKAVELTARLTYPHEKFDISLEGNYFHTIDYVIGQVYPELSAMTIGADGVKIYENLRYANLYNVSLDSRYQLSPELTWTGVVSYHRGTDQDRHNLPFISPLSYSSMLQYSQNKLNASLSMKGAAAQVDYNPEFGEDQTEAYTVFSFAAGTTFTINDHDLNVKAGVENIFDKYYSTYADWNNIPRMGRNFFMTLSYAVN